MIGVGQWAFDSVRKSRVQVIERNELWGYVSYKVYDPVVGNVYQIAADYLKELDKGYCSEAFIRYITSLARVKDTLARGMFSSLSEKLLPLPHQLYAVKRALSGNRIRYLLADEVGLGKTIEAGLIIKELKERGIIKRILIVCHKGLVTQWYVEMKDKFGEHFNIILPEDHDAIKRLHGVSNVYEAFDQIISPMDSIKPLERRAGWDREKIERYNSERVYSIVNSGWDLIVIDEAHRVAGSSSDVARYKLAKLLAKASPYLLLLTATPHSGKAEPFLRLMRLLDEKAFPDQRAIVKEQVAPYIIRTEKREAVDHEGNRLFKNRITKAIHIKWGKRHSLQRELYDMVTEYVRHGYNRAIIEKKYHIGFLMILMQRLVTSSTAAIRDSIERRISILESQEARISELSLDDLMEMDAEAALDVLLQTKAINLKAEIAELKGILAVAQQAEHQFIDAKAEHLIELLDRLFIEENGRKVIVFTEFVATQRFLKEFLERRGYRVSILNGSMSIDERNAVIEEFKTQSDILISTDAGGEGINLQFSNVVINYDLPWNPMKIEQRIGRVDRIGQSRDVLVFNYILEDTVESRVREVLEEKLAIIFEQMGIDKMGDVLDSQLADMDFTELYIKAIAEPRNADYYIQKLEAQIRQEIEQAQKVRDLIKTEKSFDLAFAASIRDYNMKELMRHMYLNYKAWKGENVRLELLDIDLNNQKISEIIKGDFYWDKADGAVVINLPDLPNEKGYWSLWELSLGPDIKNKCIVPVFINVEGVVRPVSARRIWDEMIKPGRAMEILGVKQLSDEEFDRILSIAKDAAYHQFLEMKKRFDEENANQYQKYLYALDLRLEAAGRIGIENIKRRRIEQLEKEKEEIQAEYAYKSKPCPTLKPIFIAFME